MISMLTFPGNMKDQMLSLLYCASY